MSTQNGASVPYEKNERRHKVVSRMSILLIEDDEESRMYLARLLCKLGYKVKEASRGGEALDMLEENDISLVISDVFLPELSGIEIMKKLKRKKRNKNVRFIFFSGFVDEQMRQEALQEGAMGYFFKPVNIMQILALVGAGMELNSIRGDSDDQGTNCG